MAHLLAEDPARPSVLADLLFWTVVGAGVAATAGRLDSVWGVPYDALLAGALALAVVGVLALLGVRRVRRLPRPVVWWFGVGNLVLALAVAVVVVQHWLPLTHAGVVALSMAGVVTLVLGTWQLLTARRRPM